jgi:hypothetical protein
VVNQTEGVPLNLSFIVTATPHWLGNLGGGTYTSNFEGDVVDPGGQIVGYGGPTTIHSGAVLCLKGAHTPTSEDYDLIFSYHGTIASVVVTFA